MELTAPLAYCNHAVGDKAVIENGVSFVENVHVIANLNLERALNDNVKFLTVMGVELHRSILLFGQIRKFNEERLCKLLLEFGSEVIILNAVLL